MQLFTAFMILFRFDDFWIVLPLFMVTFILATEL